MPEGAQKANGQRLTFGPYVKNLSDALDGGVPPGSWVVLYGNPGSYKTLHALAFALAGLKEKERVVYVSTEQDWKSLKAQISSLGWDYKAHDAHLTMKLLEDKDFGTFDIVWIDLDSLRYLAYALNRIVREEGAGSRRRKYYWYYDPELFTFAIILGLEGVGVIDRRESEITLEQVERLRIKEGYYAREGDSRAMLTVNKDATARVVIDSISVLFTGRWSVAGRTLTDIRVRLEAPTITYLLTSHVSKLSEDEMGSQIGHIVDGRIRLWNELSGNAGRVTGWIAKMRLTDHSRALHEVKIAGKDNKYIEWSPLTR